MQILTNEEAIVSNKSARKIAYAYKEGNSDTYVKKARPPFPDMLNNTTYLVVNKHEVFLISFVEAASTYQQQQMIFDTILKSIKFVE